MYRARLVNGYLDAVQPHLTHSIYFRKRKPSLISATVTFLSAGSFQLTVLRRIISNLLFSMALNVVILGATGGVGKAAAVKSLENGYSVTLLVRDPARLDPATKNANIITGDATNPEDLKKVLVNQDVLLFTIGGKPGFSFTQGIVNDNPTVCADGMKAVSQVYAEATESIELPKNIIAVSTTGLVKGMTDVPFLLKPLYKLLHGPHVDKRNMEANLASISGVRSTVVRPTLLTDGEGSTTVRSGPEAIGYSVSRQSVGWYIADNLITSESNPAEVLLSN